jgi:hypothetical protein
VYILEHDERGIVIEADAEFLACRPAIGQKPCLEIGIDPGAGHDLRPERWRAGIQDFNLAANLMGADQLCLDQEFANGGLHDLVVAGRGALPDLGMRLSAIMIVVVTFAWRSHASNPFEPGLEYFDA